ncbi:collagenase [Sphaerisporangium krabiense]|uniref:microbial collagenase n=1 Tax=Sphaerisporangium krabiense TaxID=763782 RepID=A0A7W9DTC7_9ACTN|nr:collagenase [Sphaerisporangium krabiense]MBB5630652.1 microbial collagenase [Sphaerisporangium krabiense]
MRITSFRRRAGGRLPATAAACLSLGLALQVLAGTPAGAAEPPPSPAARTATQPPPVSPGFVNDGADHVRRTPKAAKDRAPLPAARDALRQDYDRAPISAEHPRPSMRGPALAGAAACAPADFAGGTAAALADRVRAATTDCVTSLFSLSGADARGAFAEPRMAAVAAALRGDATAYTGDDGAGAVRLLRYLQAGYAAQRAHPSDVGAYGATLRTATRAALDAFFANPRSTTVGDAAGEVLSEAVTLIDAARENARYLRVLQRLLDGYDASYDAHWWMVNAVNNVYNVLFGGHSAPGFAAAVQADPAILGTLRGFAVEHLGLLGTDRGFLTANAGRELARFLQYPALRDAVRPMAKDLLGRTRLTGPTAALSVGVAEMASSLDKASCGYYGVCDLRQRLAVDVLTVTYTCSSSLRIRAQQMTSAQLSGTCASLANQDAYFHSIAKDGNRPVAYDYNTTLEVCVFDSSTDYQTYAGAMFGIDTNNGGMYLEGDPSASGNQPRFIAYEAEWVRPTFEIWNLNHEYTHYLDGRFNMYGDFTAGVSTPTIWWIEGFAEYISYHYRGVRYDAAMTEAGYRTYALSTLFGTTYSHDTTRIYRWGYLAVRYMIEQRPADVATVLGYYRSGSWSTARSFLTGSIGTRYDSAWWTWLAACAAGTCPGGGGDQAPTAGFTYTASGLTANFTDTSTDDGTIAARQWDFGDATSSTAANPSHTYAAAGAYTVKLTVTDNSGKTGTVSKQVTVSTGGTSLPECAAARTDELGRNCQRGNLSATTGNYKYFYLYVPAGVSRLTITSSGGTGNADLYYSSSSWATTSAYSQRSANAGNGESLVVGNPVSGYHYISLYATQGFGGAAVQVQY